MRTYAEAKREAQFQAVINGSYHTCRQRSCGHACHAPPPRQSVGCSPCRSCRRLARSGRGLCAHALAIFAAAQGYHPLAGSGPPAGPCVCAGRVCPVAAQNRAALAVCQDMAVYDGHDSAAHMA